MLNKFIVKLFTGMKKHSVLGVVWVQIGHIGHNVAKLAENTDGDNAFSWLSSLTVIVSFRRVPTNWFCDGHVWNEFSRHQFGQNFLTAHFLSSGMATWKSIAVICKKPSNITELMPIWTLFLNQLASVSLVWSAFNQCKKQTDKFHFGFFFLVLLFQLIFVVIGGMDNAINSCWQGANGSAKESSSSFRRNNLKRGRSCA